MDPLNILIGFGKFIGNVKAIKNVSDFVTEDREAKRKEQERQKAKQELRENAKKIRDRNFFEALLMYVMAGAAGAFCIIKWGMVGIVFTLLAFIGHLSELTEVSKLTSIRREIILSVLLGIFFLVVLLQNFLNR